MKTLLLLGVLTGLDNLQVTPALGVLPLSARRRLAWALMFGLAEALMPLLGLALGLSLHQSFAAFAGIVGPVVLLLCGLAVIVMTLRRHDLTHLAANKWAIVTLPLAFSLDNLLAGVGLGAAGASLLVSALVVGGLSTALGLAGLYAGHHLRRVLPGRPEFFSGTYLVLLGLVGLLQSPLGWS